MQFNEILDWLHESNPLRLDELWRRADQTRRQQVGEKIHLRGLIEISNHCVRLCTYCGLRAANQQITRYRMTADEILACARQAVDFGYGTVVLQSGEDTGIHSGWMADVIRQIKAETVLAVTLSLGERDPEELAQWRSAGADRYLLRFETSEPELYERIHPARPGAELSRMDLLERARKLGYEVGSGVMIGIPGQSFESLARDIELFGRLNLDMIGVGPFLPHPHTPLGQTTTTAGNEQVPNNELMTYKVIALTRLTCPQANIPSTTALATLNKTDGRELGLMRGANIVMPNLTPVQYRIHYEIYPDKACINETGEACNHCLSSRIKKIGREIGAGRGDSPNYHSNTALPN